MKGSLGVAVRRLLLWSASAGLAFLGVYAAVESRYLTGGGSLFFVIAASIMVPPVHAWWKRRFPSSPYVAVVPLLLAGVVLLLHTRDERADQAARAAGWLSASDQRRAYTAGFPTPETWAPKRKALAEEEARAQAAREEAARQARLAEEAAKRQKELVCRATLSCWAERTIITASLKCREPVERWTRYSFRWVDKWYEPKFSHYRWASQGEGTVTYIGDRIEMQNVFGAWAPHIYECDDDPETKQVLAVRAQPGRL
jgi:hypothetical protein